MSVPSDSYNQIFTNKQKVLVVMPHPDDTELYCGGTVARLVQEKKRVRVVKMTNGDRGSRQEVVTQDELGKLRQNEDRNGMKLLGVRDEDNIYLGLPDGGVENDMGTVERIAHQIRIFRPDLVITTNPEDVIIRFGKDINWVNHRDHRNTALSVIDAVYPYARDTLFFPHHFKEKGVVSHSVKEFLLVDYYHHPDNVYIEVTDSIDVRIKAHAAHSSQYSLQAAEESADFFTAKKEWGKKRFETFRYVIAD